MKVFFDVLGCEKNVNDSQFAMGILKNSGHTFTDDPEEADALMILTCGFINDAKKQSIEHIFDLVELAGDDKLLIISGCLAERYKDELAKQIPEADVFVGVNDYDSLPELLDKAEKGKQIKKFMENYADFLPATDRDYSACQISDTVKISEGCNNFCTYCAIPYIRGTYRSKKMEDIIDEVTKMAAAGVKELNVIAEDTTFYGKDIYGEYKLAELLTKLCRIDGIEWIRLLYCYEESITDELIEVVAKEEKIAKYFDIAIQHASNKILKAMNRQSTKESIMATVGRLRERIPGVHIRTTVITGFPGETKEDFEELLDFVELMRFDRLGAFSYSREEDTPAASMPNQVRQDVKDRRRDKVMALQNIISNELNQAKIGTVQEVIVEEIDEDGSYIGRSKFDAIDIDDSVLFTSEKELKPGDFCRVQITDAFDYDLVGYAL